MLNQILADLYKLRKTSSIKILFVISLICASTMTAMAYLISNGTLDKSLSGPAFLLSDVSMLGILGALFAGLYISGDFENKAIHSSISNGVTRGSIIVGKSVVFFISIAILILPYVICIIISLSLGARFSADLSSLGFLNLLISGSSASFAIADIPKFVLVIIVLAIVYLAQLSICIPLSITIKKPVIIMAIYYAFSFLTGQLMLIQSKNELFEKIYSFTPYGGTHGVITLTTGTGDIIKALIVSIVFISIMLAIANGAFRKSDVK